MRLLAASSYDRGEIFRLAEKYRSQRRIRKAIREYEKILSLAPSLSTGWGYILSLFVSPVPHRLVKRG